MINRWGGGLWNKMSVEDKHIMEGQPDSCIDCPIALAMKDYEAAFNNPNAGFRPHITTQAEDWLGEDEDGAMSHRIIVHPDDVETVQTFIEDFDAEDGNPHSNDEDEYYDWEEQYRNDWFAPFTFRYRVILWNECDKYTLNGEIKLGKEDDSEGNKK